MRKLIIIPEINYMDIVERLALKLSDCPRELWASPEYLNVNQEQVKRLSDSGVDIRSYTMDSLSVAHEHGLIIGHETNWPWKEWISRGEPFLSYTMSTDPVWWLPPPDGHFFFYNSESQMRMILAGGQYWPEDDGQVLCGRVPGGGEGAMVGSLRHGTVPPASADLETQRTAAKIELAKELGLKEFSSDRPLLLQHLTKYVDEDSRDAAFERLSQKAALLLKELNLADYWHQSFSKAAGDNIFKYFHAPPRDLDRRAADFVLPVAYSSGALTTSLMMGCRVIPIFTRRMIFSGEGKYRSFGHIMRLDHDALCLKVLEHIPPICLESTDMLLERINDTQYWEEYDRNLASLQKAVFGHYRLLPDSMDTAAMLTRRILERGTMAP